MLKTTVILLCALSPIAILSPPNLQAAVHDISDHPKHQPPHHHSFSECMRWMTAASDEFIMAATLDINCITDEITPLDYQLIATDIRDQIRAVIVDEPGELSKIYQYLNQWGILVPDLSEVIHLYLSTNDGFTLSSRGIQMITNHTPPENTMVRRTQDIFRILVIAVNIGLVISSQP